MQRSGNAAANGASPVGPSIAAVMPTTSGRFDPSATISSANTLVQPTDGGPVGRPVSGSNAAGLCICSTVSFSAGGYPAPLRVTAWTITGPPKWRARRSADSIAAMSCPSTGPKYLRPRSENSSCGLSASFMPAFSACSPA
jgi:hypothetical protein